MKKATGFFWMMILLWGNVFGQQNAFTLQEAVAYAQKNNTEIRKSDNEVLKARKKVWETTTMGLPQVSGNVSYQKFIDKPVNLMPARIFNPQAPPDQYVPVSFGTEQNMKWNLTVTQLVFSGSYITGLYSSRVYKKISELASHKTRQKIAEAVTEAYVNAVLADENLRIVQKNIQALEKNLFDTRQMYENGFVEETDVRQLEITLRELKDQYEFLEKMKNTAYEMLNYLMGRTPDDALVLTDNIENLIEKSININFMEKDFRPEENIDFKIAQNKVRAGKLKMRYEQTQMLPTVSAFYSLGKNAYNEEFKFFDDNQQWYKQSLVGISINIPVFSSFVRYKRIGQAKLDFENAKLDFENTRRMLKIKYDKLMSEYLNTIDIVHTRKKNMDLSEEIMHREEVKYKEGVGNSFQLNLARMQFYQSQQAYLKSVADLVTKKTELQHFLNAENE